MNPPSVSWEIIVVDGGSFDGCGEMLAERFPKVRFVQSIENIGFGQCNNLAADVARAPVLVLLNPDTEVRAGALDLLVAALRGSADAGVVGARLLNSDGSLQTCCVRALPTPWNRALAFECLSGLFVNSRLWGMQGARHATSPVAVEAVSGACMALRASVFKRLKGFDPRYFMYGEDMDLCMRVARLGLKVYHAPAAVVVHHGGGSSRTQADQYGTIMARISAETYMMLNHGRWTALQYRVLQGVSALARILLVLAVYAVWFSRWHDSVRSTVSKWWFVLMWSLGKFRMHPPTCNNGRTACS